MNAYSTPAAEHPAGVGAAAAAGEHGSVRSDESGAAVADIAVSETAGGVDEGAVEGEAGASAHGAEPVAVVAVTGETLTEVAAAAAEIGVLDVRLETDDELAELIVVADLATADEAAVAAAAADKPSTGSMKVLLSLVFQP